MIHLAVWIVSLVVVVIAGFIAIMSAGAAITWLCYGASKTVNEAKPRTVAICVLIVFGFLIFIIAHS